MSDELFEQLYTESEKLLEEAVSYAQIGKFSKYTTTHIWRNRELVDVTEEEWLASPEKGKVIKLHVSVDVKEFNPQAYDYEREIEVNRKPYRYQCADGKWKSSTSDWFAIFVPSVIEATGIKEVPAALKFLDGKYVKILDVPQQPRKENPDKIYNTAKLAQVYDSREEAYAAYQALRGGNTTEAAPVASTSSGLEKFEHLVPSVKQWKRDNPTATPAEIAKLFGFDLTADIVSKILEN